MDNVIRAIPVRDSHGDQLMLYEYAISGSYQPTMSLTADGGATRLALDTGEEVKRLSGDVFVIVATGERLTRVA